MGLFNKADKHNALDSSCQSLSGYVDSLLEDGDDNNTPASAPPQTACSRNTVIASSPKYGIEQAIALMRRIPLENADVIVNVVRETLESAEIGVADIVVDAEQKADGLEQNISQLKDKIAQLEAEIQDKQAQIRQAETELSETTKVRELLEDSLKEKHQGRKKAEVRNLPEREEKRDTSVDVNGAVKRDAKTDVKAEVDTEVKTDLKQAEKTLGEVAKAV